MTPLVWVPIAAMGVVTLALVGGKSTSATWRKMVFDGQRVLVLGGDRSRALVYFHGNGAEIEEIAGAITMLVAKAKRPPMVILPQLTADGRFAPFLVPGGWERFLAATGASGKMLDLVAHSGGYLAAASAIHASTKRISGVGLLDALYADAASFDLVVQRGGKLVDVYGPTTAAQSLALAGQLKTKLGSSAVEIADAGAGSASLSKVASGKRATFVRSATDHTQVPARYLTEVIDALG